MSNKICRPCPNCGETYGLVWHPRPGLGWYCHSCDHKFKGLPDLRKILKLVKEVGVELKREFDNAARWEQHAPRLGGEPLILREGLQNAMKAVIKECEIPKLLSMGPRTTEKSR